MNIETYHIMKDFVDVACNRDHLIVLHETNITLLDKKTFQEKERIEDCLFGTTVETFGDHYLAVIFNNVRFRIYDLNTKEQIGNDCDLVFGPCLTMEFQLSEDEKKLYVTQIYNPENPKARISILSFPELKEIQALESEEREYISYHAALSNIVRIIDDSLYNGTDTTPFYRNTNSERIHLIPHSHGDSKIFLRNQNEIIVLSKNGEELFRTNILKRAIDAIDGLSASDEKRFLVDYTCKMSKDLIGITLRSRSTKALYWHCLYDIAQDKVLAMEPSSKPVTNLFVIDPTHYGAANRRICFFNKIKLD